jgi:hypothetical protein
MLTALAPLSLRLRLFITATAILFAAILQPDVV